MGLERQIFLQKEGRYSVQQVLHYPTVHMKVKTPALIGEVHVNLGCLYTPTKRSDAQPLVEREKQFECLPVEILKS